MPRVASAQKDVANRFIVKSVALKNLLIERAETVELLNASKDKPLSSVYKMATNAITRIDEYISSECNSLLGMHQKLVEEDMDTFLAFVGDVATTHFLAIADDVEAAKFTTMFGVTE